MEKFSKKNTQNNLLNFGFSLMELIVVVSIIAILSGISAFALGDARSSGRDSKRKGDLAQIAQGIELYKADCNYYPNTIPLPNAVLTGVAPCSPTTTNRYIEAVPDDPDTNLNYVYRPYTSSGGLCAGNCARFQLWTRLENAPASLPTYCTGGAPSCGSLACNFCIINP